MNKTVGIHIMRIKIHLIFEFTVYTYVCLTITNVQEIHKYTNWRHAVIAEGYYKVSE